jgi:4-aminobutyrate aminotransferase/(S)-3-amino-2-methylpropionate transaminase
MVYSHGVGANVYDPDGNRYVDLAAGFGAQLLGHCHPELSAVIATQAHRLTQALGDVYPCLEKLELQEQLATIAGPGTYQVILGQSGADAVTAALKTAVLATGRAGVVSLSGAYHGLSYGPLALCQLRDGYRAPFVQQLNPHVHSIPFPTTGESAAASLAQLDDLLKTGSIGAVVLEPILGRGGCCVPPTGYLNALTTLCRDRGALSVCDEILSGLGRAGAWLMCQVAGVEPDVICVGKGLGGGLPISGCIAKSNVMQAWAREAEVVHTTTFAGSPLAAAAALRLLDILRRDQLIERTFTRGAHFIQRLRDALSDVSLVREVRGRGLLVGIDVGPRAGMASNICQRLLVKGWIASTGGGTREVVVLTPPLTISDALLSAAVDVIHETLLEAAACS